MSECMRGFVGFEQDYKALVAAPPKPIDVEATVEQVASTCGLEVIE